MCIDKKDKIILALLPYWAPVIPPVGIASLKSFLQMHGYNNVTLLDANIDDEFKMFYARYFNILNRVIPDKKKGNIHNIGNTVWQDHALAKINSSGRDDYFECIKVIVKSTFFTEISDTDVMELDESMECFYSYLDTYIRKLIAIDDIKIIGLSVYSDTLPASLFAFRLIKSLNSEIITVMGGGIFSEPLSPGSPNYEYFIEETKEYIDKIIVGEGELLFLEFLKGNLDSSKRVYTLNDLNGQSLDLTVLREPSYDDLNVDNYLHLSTFSSRSCIFQCSFCSESNLWGKYRKKLPIQVKNELLSLNKKFGSQVFLLGDSLLNPIINQLSNEMKDIHPKIYWDGYLRADKHVCDKENTLLWRSGGYYRARLGLESGSDRILGLMGKKITAEQIRSALVSLAYAGIKTTTYWVIGYPGETEKDFQDTLNLIDEMSDFIYEADCNPFAFFLSGQHNSEDWKNQYPVKLLYPKKYEDMVFVKTWYMECEPNREEVFSRVNRFVTHCKKLGIPNPYSIHEIFMADERWKRLTINAVPSLAEIIQENKSNKQLSENTLLFEVVKLEDKMNHDGDWGF